jgi:hypothetical protein
VVLLDTVDEHGDAAAVGELDGVNAIYIDRFDYMWLGTGREGAFRSVDMGEREIFRPVLE